MKTPEYPFETTSLSMSQDLTTPELYTLIFASLWRLWRSALDSEYLIFSPIAKSVSMKNLN